MNQNTFTVLLLQAIAQLFKYLAVATGYVDGMDDLKPEETPEAIVKEVEARVYTDEFK